MTSRAIEVENIGKKYFIGKVTENGNSRMPVLRRVSTAIRNLGGSIFGGSNEDVFWALKNISFEVRAGEVLGIIGHNGAGKSTMLKILSRITEPTEGRALINGRVGSLLEVGTGFHPELTGRENIYLNGAILGMKRHEINRKFDEIVAFAEIEQFINTPVKRYSSGMYVRLAFAVAAHLEPEILLIDEVLAVGDAAFQKKCLGKMDDVAKEGRTILFVSHNMIAMQSLCQRVVWLGNGKLKADGETRSILSQYFQGSVFLDKEQNWNDIETAPGNETIRLHRICVHNADKTQDDVITMESPVVIEVEYWNLEPDVILHIHLQVSNEDQSIAFSTTSYETDPVWRKKRLDKGLYFGSCIIPGSLLNEGLYHISVFAIRDYSTVIYKTMYALSFKVLDFNEREGSWYGKEPGIVRPKLLWKTERLGNAKKTDI